MKRTLASLGVLVALALVGSYAFAATDLLPNLKALPASNIRIENTKEGKTLLRFSTTSWNSGMGALELRAGEIDTGAGRQNIYQRVYDVAGWYHDELAGTFVWHSIHNHFHFEDYATYTLQLIAAPGGSDRFGAKTTFCVMDTTRIDTRLTGASKKAVYATCGNTVQGMSVGWGDTYGYQLAGQEIDPKDKIIESEDVSDNVSTVDLHLENGSVSVIGGKPGRR